MNIQFCIVFCANITDWTVCFPLLNLYIKTGVINLLVHFQRKFYTNVILESSITFLHPTTKKDSSFTEPSICSCWNSRFENRHRAHRQEQEPEDPHCITTCPCSVRLKMLYFLGREAVTCDEFVRFTAAFLASNRIMRKGSSLINFIYSSFPKFQHSDSPY